jgi:hypothetical protein
MYDVRVLIAWLSINYEITNRVHKIKMPFFKRNRTPQYKAHFNSKSSKNGLYTEGSYFFEKWFRSLPFFSIISDKKLNNPMPSTENLWQLRL